MNLEEIDSVLLSESAHLAMYRAVKDRKSEAATLVRVNDLLDRRSSIYKYNSATSGRALPKLPHLSHDQMLDLEFAFVTWEDSCRSAVRDNLCCRRLRGHTQGKHASGFGPNRVEWAVA
jgi:hypothetical protein